MKSQKQLLDELMGKDRNSSNPQEKKPQEQEEDRVRISDPRLCRAYLCGFCPRKLLANTKSDLGPCSKLHDDEARTLFKTLPLKQRQSLGYERELYESLLLLLKEIEEKGKERLILQQMEPQKLPMPEEISVLLCQIEEKITSLVGQIEQLGDEGKVSEAQAVMFQVEELRREKEKVETPYISSTPQLPATQIDPANPNELLILRDPAGKILPQEKRMTICKVCGALLVIGDTQQRITAHIEGKQHLGFVTIHQWIDEYEKEHHISTSSNNNAQTQQNKRQREGDQENEDYHSHRSRHGHHRSHSNHRHSLSHHSPQQQHQHHDHHSHSRSTSTSNSDSDSDSHHHHHHSHHNKHSRH